MLPCHVARLIDSEDPVCTDGEANLLTAAIHPTLHDEADLAGRRDPQAEALHFRIPVKLIFRTRFNPVDIALRKLRPIGVRFHRGHSISTP